MSSENKAVTFSAYCESLTQLVTSLVTITRPITQGRKSKLGQNTLREQLFKIIEEVMETQKEIRCKNTSEELDESLDIMFSWLAFCHSRGYTEQKIKESVQREIQKFYSRGWINF